MIEFDPEKIVKYEDEKINLKTGDICVIECTNKENFGSNKTVSFTGFNRKKGSFSTSLRDENVKALYPIGLNVNDYDKTVDTEKILVFNPMTHNKVDLEIDNYYHVLYYNKERPRTYEEYKKDTEEDLKKGENIYIFSGYADEGNYPIFNCEDSVSNSVLAVIYPIEFLSFESIITRIKNLDIPNSEKLRRIAEARKNKKQE